MIRRAFRRAFDDDEIEDIYSSAWLGTLRALERRHQGLSDEEIRRYVLAAVANHASKELRRRRRRPTTPLDTVPAVPDDSVPPDERATKLEESRLTRDLLSSLPPRRRAVMLLRYGWGLEPRQVCGLVKGLSARAYRKEITRGVDELTDKLRLVHRGEWCAEREPVLKAYAAGLADLEQQRQAQQHLSHCRQCNEFVGRLSGHLHDVGASVAASGAVDGIDDGRLSLPDRLGDAIHRVRDSTANVLSGHTSDQAPDAATQALGVPGTARGAGAAGTGVLAKLAGVGAASKLAAVCLGGGVAATACVAAGVLPATLPGLGAAGEKAAPGREVTDRPHVVAEPPPVAIPPPQREPAGSPAPGDGGPPTDDQAQGSDPVPAPAPEPPPPIEPSAPPAQQEFGVAAAAPAPPSNSGPAPSSSGGGGGSAVQREFGP